MSGVGIPVTPSHPYFSPSIFTPSFTPLSRSTLSLSPCTLGLPPSGTLVHPFLLFLLRIEVFLSKPLGLSREDRVPLIVLINNAPMIRLFPFEQSEYGTTRSMKRSNAVDIFAPSSEIFDFLFFFFLEFFDMSDFSNRSSCFDSRDGSGISVNGAASYSL